MDSVRLPNQIECMTHDTSLPYLDRVVKRGPAWGRVEKWRLNRGIGVVDWISP